MGKRGPARKPTPQLKLVGSRRGRQRAAKEPPTNDIAPTPPDLVTNDPVAMECWQRLTAELRRTPGMCTLQDGNALARYCLLYSRWTKACEYLAKNGEMYVIKSDDGNPKCFAPWPQVSIAAKCSEQMLRLEQQFGLTPSARAGLTPKGAGPTATPQSELLAFNAKKRQG